MHALGSNLGSWTSLAIVNGHNVVNPVGNFCATTANHDSSVSDDRPVQSGAAEDAIVHKPET